MHLHERRVVRPPSPCHACHVIALVTSAGGLAALRTVLGGLPADLPACILVLQHLDPHRRSLLPPILANSTALVVKPAVAGAAVRPGVVYIASPDRHLVVTPQGRLSLTQTIPVNFTRPAADVLLTALAGVYQTRAIAVVLTGMGSDGARGVCEIKRLGGQVIVQDPQTAAHPGMPQAAVNTGSADYVIPLEDIATRLMAITGASVNA